MTWGASTASLGSLLSSPQVGRRCACTCSGSVCFQDAALTATACAQEAAAEHHMDDMVETLNYVSVLEDRLGSAMDVIDSLRQQLAQAQSQAQVPSQQAAGYPAASVSASAPGFGVPPAGGDSRSPSGASRVVPRVC